ncbi:MAG: HDOD domain-containing protein [Deltaproteobacteria bacterium]|nr:HDOD domain-containing protein [Deltaproteobacteria bacterium]
MLKDNEYSYDILIENVRKDYERNHIIDDDVIKTFSVLRKKFENSRLSLPLVPLYVSGILEKYIDFRTDQLASPYSNDDFMNQYNVLGSMSVSSHICLDPILGPHIFHYAKRFFFKKLPQVTYKECFQTLDWQQLDDLLMVMFFNVPLFSSYSQLPEFTSRWEFASMGALYATRVAKAFKLPEQEEEELFLATLIKDVSLPALYWEFPILKSSEFLRSIKENSDIKIDKDLFDAIKWHFHAHLSSKIAKEWGFSHHVVEAIENHHLPVSETTNLSIGVRRLKFINELTNYVIKNGVRDLSADKLKNWQIKLGMSDLNSVALEELCELIKTTRLVNMDQSLVDIESNTMGVVTEYETLDADKDTFIMTPDSPYFQVNLLQDAKDKKQELFNAYFFNKDETEKDYLKKMARLRLLNALYKTENLDEVAAELQTTIKELEKELDNIQITEINISLE